MFMYIHEIISEKFVNTLVPTYANHGGRNPVDIYLNPSTKEWKLLGDEARGYVIGNDLMVWSAYGIIHREVHDQLKLDKDAIPVYVYGKLRNDAFFVVSDASKNTKWHHNPDVARAIKKCQFIANNFSDIEISYYDDAIYGNWEYLEDEDDI